MQVLVGVAEHHSNNVEQLQSTKQLSSMMGELDKMLRGKARDG
jgi:hypothetical protein